MNLTPAWIAAALAGTVFASACAAPTPAAPTTAIAADQPFVLRAGATAEWREQALKIGMESVTADSRCAKGTQCVWAGDATVRVWVQHRGGAKDIRELHTSAQAARAVVVDDLLVTLVSLDPQPVANRALDKAAYAATLTVRRTAQVGSPTETPSGPVPGASQADR